MARPQGFALNDQALEDLVALTKPEPMKWSELAEKADNLSPSVLSDLRNGRRRASYDTAVAIARALGVRVGVLFPELARTGRRTFQAVDLPEPEPVAS